MGKKKKEGRLTRWLAELLGLLCALVLGGVFYATMVYQLADEEKPEVRASAFADWTPAPLDRNAAPQDLFPGPLLALEAGTLTEETAQDAVFGGQTCRIITRTYQLEDGSFTHAVSAAPAAYLERLSEEGWQAQLITGFVLGEMEAVYSLKGDAGMLTAREGDCIYMLETAADEQAAYELGTRAVLEALPGR